MMKKLSITVLLVATFSVNAFSNTSKEHAGLLMTRIIQILENRCEEMKEQKISEEQKVAMIDRASGEIAGACTLEEISKVKDSFNCVDTHAVCPFGPMPANAAEIESACGFTKSGISDVSHDCQMQFMPRAAPVDAQQMAQQREEFEAQLLEKEDRPEL